jgi:FMN reductase (NADPH)
LEKIEMNETIELLLKRRSVRSFAPQKIEEEQIALLKEATLRAPTAGNMVLYSILEIDNQATKEELARLCDNQIMIAKAPLVWVFVADLAKWVTYYREEQAIAKAQSIQWREPAAGDLMLAIDDALIAAQNAVIAAEALGLGSCYIGDVLEQHEDITELLQLPPYTAVATMVIFGLPPEHFGSQTSQSLRPAAEHVFMQEHYRPLELAQLREAYGKQEEQMRKQRRLPYDNQGTIADYYYLRKYCSSFMEEMNRSVRLMLQQWL